MTKLSTYEWHEVTPEDQKRITCDDCSSAGRRRPAELCEHAGRSFFYYCFNHAIERGFHHSLVPPLYHSSPEPIPLDEERQSGPDAWEGGFTWNH